MSRKRVYAAFDIGAGRGTKIGLFLEDLTVLSETLLPLTLYGELFEEFAQALLRELEKSLKAQGLLPADVLSVGISTAGILDRDGSFLLFINQPLFNGSNLKKYMEEALSCPAAIANDADAGGLAEWSVMRTELLYWVFGGGWGGSWISRDGRVLHSSDGWDRNDSSLHYTNEPGYAIPLDKLRLRILFSEVGASYDLFEKQLRDDPTLPEWIIQGPNGNPEALRAEVILSGSGRCRLFRSIVGDDDFYEKFLDIHEVKEMLDPTIAGRHIDKLSGLRVEAAINTDRLYGKILAEAARIMLKSAQAEGMPPGLPICMGGKPSYALPYFGPSCQRLLGKMGYMNYLRPSILDERGSNANLIGAAVLAQNAAGDFA
ncbi:MAG: ROK family protein [Spirochaetales bacterium]|nr:ROK family protein [Spirochaetales bacterium]